MKCKLKDSDDVSLNIRNPMTLVVGGCQVLSKSIIDNESYIENAKKIHIHKEAINNCDFFGVLNLCRSGKLEFIKDDLDSLIKMYTGKNTKSNIEDLTK